MKRLVILTYDFRPNNGGIARLCSEIENCCIKYNVDYLVVTNVPGEADDHIVRICGRRGILELKILRYLRNNLKEGDVILTGTFHPDGILGILSGFPTFYLAHGAEFLPGKTFFRKHIWPLYRNIVLKLPIKIITNSHYTANLVKSCGKTTDIVPIPLAVDEQRFCPTKEKINDGKLHICSISRLEKFKAQDFVIQTIAELPQECKEKICFDIAGKGICKLELEKLVIENALQEQVKFIGFVADNDLCDFYSSHDLFILTTRLEPDNVEGFGLVFAEAQSCGTACIGSKSGGIPDAVEDGNGGWLIDQDNKEQLTIILKNLVDDRHLVIDACERARHRIVTSCTWEMYFKNLIDTLS